MGKTKGVPQGRIAISKVGGFQPNKGKGPPTPPPNKGSGGKKGGTKGKSR